jgi:hypothetical protein
MVEAPVEFATIDLQVNEYREEQGGAGELSHCSSKVIHREP